MQKSPVVIPNIIPRLLSTSTVTFWTDRASFYLDWGYLGRQDRSMPTSKEIKDSYVQKEGGKVASGMQYQGFTTISHGRGVIECFRHEGNINRELFSQFAMDRFPHIFSKENNQKGKLFLQDGDPSQNCKMSQEAMDKIPYRLFMIPPPSLDLNSIENVFHLVGMCV